MIDLLINMSEIYGQPSNGNNSVRSHLQDDDEEEEDEEFFRDDGEQVNGDEHDGYDDNSVSVDRLGSNSFANCK